MPRNDREMGNTNENAGTPPVAEAPKTEEQIAEEKAKDEARKARRAAQVKVREYAGKLDDVELKDAIFLLVGSGSRAVRGGVVRSINKVLLEALTAAGDNGITEMDIFKQFKIGRPEMTAKTRIFLKSEKAEDRVWVKFTEEDETYRIVATGAVMPEGWDGFKPAEENTL